MREIHWKDLRDQRVMSTVHCKVGDRIVVVTAVGTGYAQAIEGMYVESFLRKYSDEYLKFQVTLLRLGRPMSAPSRLDDSRRFCFKSEYGYMERFTSDCSMDYDAGAYPNSTNYVLNLDTLERKGIKVIGYANA